MWPFNFIFARLYTTCHFLVVGIILHVSSITISLSLGWNWQTNKRKIKWWATKTVEGSSDGLSRRINWLYQTLCMVRTKWNFNIFKNCYAYEPFHFFLFYFLFLFFNGFLFLFLFILLSVFLFIYVAKVLFLRVLPDCLAWTDELHYMLGLTRWKKG